MVAAKRPTQESLTETREFLKSVLPETREDAFLHVDYADELIAEIDALAALLDKSVEETMGYIGERDTIASGLASQIERTLRLEIDLTILRDALARAESRELDALSELDERSSDLAKLREASKALVLSIDTERGTFGGPEWRAFVALLDDKNR